MLPEAVSPASAALPELAHLHLLAHLAGVPTEAPLSFTELQCHSPSTSRNRGDGVQARPTVDQCPGADDLLADIPGVVVLPSTLLAGPLHLTST